MLVNVQKKKRSACYVNPNAKQSFESIQLGTILLYYFDEK